MPGIDWKPRWTPAPAPVVTGPDAVTAARVLDEILSRRPDLPAPVAGALLIALDWIGEEWAEAEAWISGRFSKR
jgi:hypothetical protein